MRTASKLSGVNLKGDLLTVCIPAFDNARTITACLDQLSLQELDKVNVLIVDTGSKDGTPELIEAQINHGWYKKPFFNVNVDIRLIKLPEINGKAPHVVKCMETFQKEVNTEFLFRVQPDVLMPPNCLKPLMAMLKEDKKLGMIACGYCPEKTHVPTDCTMFRTKDVKAIVWQWDKNGCDCVHAQNQLNGIYKKSIFHPELRSRKLKFL